jgi:hypothetical protein
MHRGGRSSARRRSDGFWTPLCASNAFLVRRLGYGSTIYALDLGGNGGHD